MSGPRWACELFALALFFIPAHAHACDEVIAAGPESDCVEGVKFSGNTGTWFERTKADEIKRKLRIYKELELQVDQLTFAKSYFEKESTAQRNAIALLENTQANLRRQVELTNKDAREARAALASEKRWYKSPVFWGIVMFVAGAAVQNACCSGR